MMSVQDLLVMLAIDPQSSEERVLRLLIELGAQIVGAAEGSLLAYDPTTSELVFMMTVGGAQTLIGERVPLNSGLTGLAAATREVQIGAPTFALKHDLNSYQDDSPTAVIAAPMLMADELVGVITAVSFDRAKRFTLKDGELYGRLAAIAGVVVAQGRKLRAFSEATVSDPSTLGGIPGSLRRIAECGPQALRRTETILAELADLVASGTRSQ